MTLAEIRAQVKDNCTERPGESIDEYAQRRWDNMPRIPYKELPLSLQQDVRARFPPAVIHDFLRQCSIGIDEMIAGIKDSELEKIFVRTRNNAVYSIECEGVQLSADEREEYLLAPMLYGDFAVSAFESAFADYKDKSAKRNAKNSPTNKVTTSPTTPRANNGINIVSGGFYQYAISDKKYQFALTTQRNSTAYIALMNPDFFTRLNFESGAVTYDNQTAGIVKQYINGKYTDVQNLDFPLLTQIYTAAVKSNLRQDAFTITVSLPQFFREMGIEISSGNSQDIMTKLHSFENCVGIMPGTQIVAKLFTIIEINAKNQTMTVAVPYILRLYEALEEKNHTEHTTRQGALYDYQKPYHNMLVHSSIAKERNKTAVELVYLITTGLLQRGYTPDVQTYRKKGAKTQFPDRVTYSVSFRSLINDAPLLRGRILSYKDMSNKNAALRRAFTKAYQLLESNTDAAEWFVDLHYNAIVPTMTTLDDELTFTHNGRNGDYKPKQ